MGKRKRSVVMLEAGTVGKDVWIGAPTECYEEVTKPFTARSLHILRFTLEQAESVIEMLRTEIDRQRGCYQTFDCNAGEHADCCPAKR